MRTLAGAMRSSWHLANSVNSHGSLVVGPAVFRSSPMSAYVTGVTLVVDGGFLAA